MTKKRRSSSPLTITSRKVFTLEKNEKFINLIMISPALFALSHGGSRALLSRVCVCWETFLMYAYLYLKLGVCELLEASSLAFARATIAIESQVPSVISRMVGIWLSCNNALAASGTSGLPIDATA